MIAWDRARDWVNSEGGIYTVPLALPVVYGSVSESGHESIRSAALAHAAASAWQCPPQCGSFGGVAA